MVFFYPAMNLEDTKLVYNDSQTFICLNIVYDS